MHTISTNTGRVILSMIVAIAILVVAYFEIGPEHTWLYLVGVWAVLSAALEVYAGMAGRTRR